MSDITAADVRAALLGLAQDRDWCGKVARDFFTPHEVADDIEFWSEIAARERAAMAAEARVEGER